MSRTVENTHSPRPKRRFLSRVWTFLKYAFVTLVVALVAAHFIYQFSGSGQWEPFQAKDGVTVFKKKDPGSVVVQYKGIMKVDSSLTSFTRFMQDPTTCDDVGCTDTVVIKEESPQVQYMSFVYDYHPFDKRQFVVKVDVSQDPKTKAVAIKYLGDPDLIPDNPCCVRVPRMNNIWTARPIGPNQIEVEYVVDMYEGGFLPYPLTNYFHSRTPFSAFAKISKFVKSEKYRKKYIEDGKTLPFVVDPTM